MNNLKALLTNDVKKIITDKNPVIKKKPAKWFFMNELRTNLEEEKEVEASKKESDSLSTKTKFKRAQVENLWRNMLPESKRRYFNMAKLDEFRFKEQKTLWVAEVASLIKKYANQNNNFKGFIPSLERAQRNFESSLQKGPKNCEHIIDLETTKQIYRNVIIKSKEASAQSLETKELISLVPDEYKPLLTKPRRPTTPYLLFFRANRSHFSDLYRSKNSDLPPKKALAAEWINLSPEERGIYEKEYSQLLEEYKKDMKEYELAHPISNNSSLVMASRERKTFSRTLRKKLREYDIVPVNVRNAFNFFVAENKDKTLTEITELWKNLDPEKRAEYDRRMQEDVKRYHAERLAYEELIKDLLDLLK